MANEKVSPAGWMLRHWRAARGKSQLELAAEAEVSTRHLSFVETGRAEPSRELLLRLAAALEMPARDRNALLQSAGYQAIYRETAIEAPEMAEVRRVLVLILRQHEPFAAAVYDRDGDVLMANAAFCRFCRMIGRDAPEPLVVTSPPRLNTLELTFDPAGGFRPILRNWESVARAVLARARADLGVLRDRRARDLLERVLAYPGVAALGDEAADPSPIIPLEVALPGVGTLRFLTTISMLGTPRDLTLRELHIEAFHPADEATEELVRRLT